MTNPNNEVGNLLKGTVSDFLNALEKIKGAGMESEFQAIIAHFNVLKQMISTNNNEVKATQKDNDELQNLAQLIINLTKLEYQALKEKPKHDGRKGSPPIQYQDYYDLVDEIIEKYESDLSKRGTKARIARMAEIKAGEKIDLPCHKQASNIIKEKIDNLKK